MSHNGTLMIIDLLIRLFRFDPKNLTPRLPATSKFLLLSEDSKYLKTTP